jgi:drug/metabolite transporter (DMT)-like permease
MTAAAPAGAEYPRRDIAAVVALTFMALCFGGTWVAGKVALDDLSPFTVAAARFALASVLLFAWTRLARRRISPLTRANLPYAAGMGLTAVAGYNILFLVGLTLAPASDGAIIVPGTAPILTAILAAIFLRERVGLMAAIGMGIAIGGLFLVITPAAEAGPNRLLGDALFLLGAVFWAIYGVITKLGAGQFDSVSATLYGTAIGTIVLLPPAIAEGGVGQLLAAGWLAWIGVLYLAVFGSVIAFVLVQFGIRRIGAARASVFALLVPIFGVGSSAVLLREPLTLMTLVGGALVLLGLSIVQRPHLHRHRPSPSEPVVRAP